MPTMWLQPRATPRSTLPPADHYHQDISALRDRLTGLSQASLSINESLGSVRSLTRNPARNPQSPETVNF